MRTVEIAAGVVAGVLALAVVYQLGSRAGYERGREGTVAASKIDREIRKRVDAQVAEQRCELEEAVIDRMEELLSRRPEPRVLPDPEPEPQGESDADRVKRLEAEFDGLLSQRMDGVRKELDEAAKAREERDEKQQEPFSASTLREFEEARRKMLEERRRLREAEEKRGK